MIGYFKTKAQIQDVFSYLYKNGYTWRFSQLKTIITINMNTGYKDFHFVINTDEKAFGADWDLDQAMKGLGNPSEITKFCTFEELKAAVEGKSITSSRSFGNSLIPGCFVDFEDYAIPGFITAERNLAVFAQTDGEWNIISNFTEDCPRKITRIYSADRNGNTTTIWERPIEKVKKSISEIERAMGLEPGSLEII